LMEFVILNLFHFQDDKNYPNGAKVWLVPASLITPDNPDVHEPEPCSLGTMTGWRQDEILFESSLITYGYIDIIAEESAND
jgi:hypothetical protein